MEREEKRVSTEFSSDKENVDNADADAVSLLPNGFKMKTPISS